MKITLNWLKEYLITDATIEQITATLIQLGHEIDGVEATTPDFNKVVVGKILAREQHPDADRLGVCSVDVGADEPIQIVCGAPNARAGITVAVALVGAVLPPSAASTEIFKIKKSKIRGVESNGMICSVRELQLGDEHDGIWEMDDDLEAGMPLNDALPDADTVIDVAVTPNRGDALSVYGLARDLAAAGLGTLLPLPEVKTGKKNMPQVGTDTKNCQLFAAVGVADVQNQPSPEWIQEKIMAAGLQPRSALVDITNYVMLSIGKPIHVYDADKIKGRIFAAEAKGGEKYNGLGDVSITLNAGDTVICDESGIIGLGGILGGASTAVSDETTNVLIESAYFTREIIAATGQAHNVQTDARYRFERGTDITTTQYAAEWAATLVKEVCGGEISATSAAGDATPDVATIDFNPDFVKTFGGLDVAPERIAEILTALGFGVNNTKTPWQVTAPSFRTMMSTPEDLVEEVLRVEGYDKIPARLMPTPEISLNNIAPQLRLDKMARRQLAGQGFTETITYSFISTEKAELFSEGAELYTLANPLDEEAMTTMRPSLLPGLLDAVVGNNDRSTPIAKLAEVGKVFTQKQEQIMAAGVLTPSNERNWQGTAAAPDAFSAKEEAQKLLAILGAPTAKLQVEAIAPSTYHPGRSGTLRLGKQAYAHFGEIHPKVMQKFGLKSSAMAFEIYVEPLAKMKNKTKAFAVSNFQPTQKDMAFVVPSRVAAADILRTAQKAAGELCKSVHIFDVYEGDELPDDTKSVAVSLTLQAPDRTLTDADIQAAMQATLDKMTAEFGAKLRG